MNIVARVGEGLGESRNVSGEGLEGSVDLVLPPFLPGSACATEDLRGFDWPSRLALALAFRAVALP